MRELVRRTYACIRHFIENNAWVPLAGKAFGIAGSLMLLSAIGAGIFDRTFDLGPPRAEAATPRRTPRDASIGSASPSSPSSPSSSASPTSSAPGVAAPAGSSSAAPRTPPAAKRIVLNEATASDLEALPGVGPAKAEAILALRTKLGGRFKRFEDLLRVRGIKRRALLKIREHAVLDAPPPDAPPAGPSAFPSSAPSTSPAGAPSTIARSTAALVRP